MPGDSPPKMPASGPDFEEMAPMLICVADTPGAELAAPASPAATVPPATASPMASTPGTNHVPRRFPMSTLPSCRPALRFVAPTTPPGTAERRASS